MKIVRMTCDMRPWSKGQDAVLPDDVAKRLIDNKEAEDSRPYPPPDVKPQVPVGSIKPPKTRYLTRKRG